MAELLETVLSENKEAIGALMSEFGSIVQDDEITIYRFLKARSFNLAKTREMLAEHAKLYKDKNLESIRRFAQTHIPEEFPYAGIVTKNYPHKVLLGHCKDGSPISCEQTGKVDPEGMMHEISQEDLVTYLLHQLCFQQWHMNQLSRKYGRIVRLHHVLDLAGLGMKHAHSGTAKYMTTVLKLFQDHFPEQADKLYLINVPWAFSVVFGLVKPFIDKNTQAKMKILGSTFQDELKLQMDDDIVGRFCESSSSSTKEDDSESEVSVSSGKKEVVRILKQTGTAVSMDFEFEVNSKDIRIAVQTVKSKEELRETVWSDMVIEKCKKLTTLKFDADVSAILVELDNASSKWSKRVVKMKVSTKAADLSL